MAEKDIKDGDKCPISCDNHIHHHRVHHHRHYKKFVPHLDGEGNYQTNGRNVRPRDQATSVSRVFRPKINDRDVAISNSPSGSLRSGAPNPSGAQSPGRGSAEVIEPQRTTSDRFGQLVDMDDPNETDEDQGCKSNFRSQAL